MAAFRMWCDFHSAPRQFKRGILATITMRLAQGVTGSKQVQDAFEQACQKPAVRLLEETLPRIQDVELVNTFSAI